VGALLSCRIRGATRTSRVSQGIAGLPGNGTLDWLCVCVCVDVCAGSCQLCVRSRPLLLGCILRRIAWMHIRALCWTLRILAAAARASSGWSSGSSPYVFAQACGVSTLSNAFNCKSTCTAVTPCCAHSTPDLEVAIRRGGRMTYFSTSCCSSFVRNCGAFAKPATPRHAHESSTRGA
jgi:hypothetical protein